jgi:hypothetical protein
MELKPQEKSEGFGTDKRRLTGANISANPDDVGENQNQAEFDQKRLTAQFQREQRSILPAKSVMEISHFSNEI